MPSLLLTDLYILINMYLLKCFSMIKKISQIEYQIYNKWFDHFLKETPLAGIIYLRCDPKIANERVIKRARIGETIPLTYLGTMS